MRRLGFALSVTALLVTAGSLTGWATGRFDQKLSKDKQVLHVLNRLTFGPRPGDLDRVRSVGVEKWLRQQLQPRLIAEDPRVDARLRPLASLQLATWQIFETFQPPPPTALAATVRPSPLSVNNLLSPEQQRVTRQGTVAERRALLMSMDAEKRKQVLRVLPAAAVAGIPELQREALAARQPPLFVHQELIDSRMFRALYSNRQLEEVLVDFWLNHFNVFNGKGQGRMLLTSYERARHPAMLFYLDNWQSQATREDVPGQPIPPNARRPGLNENYGRELMELHTLGVDGGYTQADVIAVARAFTGWTIYDVNRIAEFQFNPAFHDRKQKVVLGHTIPAGGGEQDGLQVIDILARHRSTARFISKKLAQRFVADVPPQSLVDRMAATFATTEGDLRAVLETMLTSREFLSEGAWQAKLKSPLEMVLSSARALGADVTDPMALAQRIADLGQPLYGKAEPTGYSTTSDAWSNSAGFLGRINFAGALARGQIDGVTIDPAHLPGDAEASARRLLGVAVSPATLKALAESAKGTPLSPANIAAIVLASPDFQRR
jgi:uncharacterized protein (DUF1800 family)